jgi:hypothetical protein
MASLVTIDYTHDYVEGEPGPNLYWRGTTADFLRLLLDMHSLGVQENIEIRMSDIDYVLIIGTPDVLAKSSKNGKTLCRVAGDKIVIDLDPSIWRQVLAVWLGISFYSSFDYIEFDEIDLIEDANFIVSSDASS